MVFPSGSLRELSLSRFQMASVQIALSVAREARGGDTRQECDVNSAKLHYGCTHVLKSITLL